MSVDDVIALLEESGWEKAGHSRGQSFKLITQESYPLAGAIVNLGNRPRFQKGSLYVTVGKRTTFFYRPENDKPTWEWDGWRFQTKDVQGIRDFVALK